MRATPVDHREQDGAIGEKKRKCVWPSLDAEWEVVSKGKIRRADHAWFCVFDTKLPVHIHRDPYGLTDKIDTIHYKEDNCFWVYQPDKVK